MLKKSMILLTMAAIAALGVYAQATNVAEKIVGTWTDEGGFIWTFTAGGDLIIKADDGAELERTRYAVTGPRLTFLDTVWLVAISTDGKTVIITESGGSLGYRLAKQE